VTRMSPEVGLTLHPDKTRLVHVGEEWVDFLGYRIRRRPNGRVALDISLKAMARTRDTLRDITRRTSLSLEELIAELNVHIRGAGEYFRLAEPRTLWNLDRVRRLPEWSLARGTHLYRDLGLATWWRRRQPQRAPVWLAREVCRTAGCGKSARPVGRGGAGRGGHGALPTERGSASYGPSYSPTRPGPTLESAVQHFMMLHTVVARQPALVKMLERRSV